MEPLTFHKDGKTLVVTFNGKPFMVRRPEDFRALTLDVRDRDRRFYDQLVQAKEYVDLSRGSRTADSFIDGLDLLLRNVLRRRRLTGR